MLLCSISILKVISNVSGCTSLGAHMPLYLWLSHCIGQETR